MQGFAPKPRSCTTWLRRLSGVVVAALGLSSSAAQALPIGFGINQGRLEYDQLYSDHFHVYFDHRVPNEGWMTLNALEAARPFVEQWIGHKRHAPLTVVTSAASENASFANFITDAIEVQTMGQGYKELAWHEYTHSTMYRSLDTIFGPPYNIIYLPWMPAWFLEGLAEAFSVSSGSDVTSGIERYQALSGNWPSYDRLHSLYSSVNYVERGYATSGALVTYLLKHADVKLPDLLAAFYQNAHPWWWPVTIIPYADLMPLDRALKTLIQLNGEELYEAYKIAAKQHWEAAPSGPFLAAAKAKHAGFPSLYGLSSDGLQIHLMGRESYSYYESTVAFDAASGWAIDTTRGAMVSDKPALATVFKGQSWNGTVTYTPDPPQDKSLIDFTPHASGEDGANGRRITRPGGVYNLWETPTHLAWTEQQQSVTRLCETPITKTSGKTRITCPLTARLPEQLRAIGSRNKIAGERITEEIWLSHATQKMFGTAYEIRVFDTNRHGIVRRIRTGFGMPISVGFAGRDSWVLLAERSERSLRRYDERGKCLSMLRFKDHILDVKGLNDGSLVLALYDGSESRLLKLPKESIHPEPCTTPTGQMSPLQFAIAQTDKSVSLSQALAGASLWEQNAGEPVAASSERFKQAPTIDKDHQPNTGSDGSIEPAGFHAKPLFVFPWIGGDDAKGLQVGVVSVPLMDDLQNETVRATFLLGIESLFPYQELALTSTRFVPTLNLAVYRQQTYEGLSYKRSTDETVTNYLDEKGVRFESLYSFRLLGGIASSGLALKYAYLKPYAGNPNLTRGFLTEPGATFSLVHMVQRFTFSNALSGRVAPSGLNQNFDYNQVGGATSVAVALPALSRLSLGLEGSRTRGAKRRLLKEVYRPLKTFIPGSGGGLNQNSFPISSVSQGLFSAQFGDTQARAKVDYTIPVVRDIDKNWWLLYFERLDFTAFFNYGAAWNGTRPPEGWGKLTRAHGYNFDLQMENKGVHFNVGGGIGQVFGRPLEPYINGGFDALF